MDIIKWARHPTHAATLHSFINSDCGEAAIAVLRQMTVLHRATPESTPQQLANDHQFNAGFQACLIAMKNLVNINPEQIAKLEQARKLNQSPSWEWVTNTTFEKPAQATPSRVAKTPRAKK